MKFEEFISSYQVRLVLKDGVALHKITPAMCGGNSATITDLHSIIFVMDGELEIKIQKKKYLLTKNCFVDLIGEQQSLMLLSGSYDLDAYYLVLTRDYIIDLFKNRPPFSVDYVLNKKLNPISVIDDNYTDVVVRCLRDLEQAFRNEGHIFRDSMIKCKTWIFFTEIANLFIQKERESEIRKRDDQKKILFMKFLKMLPFHVKKEHAVDFYASKLCVTPQYLGRVVKELSNKTVYSWISQSLMCEVCKVLDETNMPISQIAEELNFSDQAVLSKFFKRYKGVSPLNYRNR